MVIIVSSALDQCRKYQGNLMLRNVQYATDVIENSQIEVKEFRISVVFVMFLKHFEQISQIINITFMWPWILA